MMYHPSLYSQRSYAGFTGYPYADNYIRQAEYSNVDGNNNSYYQGTFQQEQYSMYRGQQRGTYEHRIVQESPYQTSQQDRSGYIPSSYTKQYNTYNDIGLQNSQTYSNGYESKSSLNAMMSRASFSQTTDKYLPPCALQYCETDGDSNEDEDVIETRNSCAYAKAYPEGSYRFNDERGINNLFVTAFLQIKYQILSRCTPFRYLPLTYNHLSLC